MSAYESAAAMAWDLAGRPRRANLAVEPAPGMCAMCGRRAEETLPARLTVSGKTFTDHGLIADRHSDRTCYACAWACCGKPPDTVRTWTVAASPAVTFGASHPKAGPALAGEHPQVLLTARDDMRQVARLLCSPPDGPWCLAVAESGKKHTLPYARVNQGAGRWRVRMDAADISGEPAVFAGVLAHAAALRVAGFTSAEIEALDPGGRLKAANLAAWREHAAALMPWRGSPLLHLACFMINKEHMDEYAMRPA